MTFKVGSVTVGSAALSSGSATLSWGFSDNSQRLHSGQRHHNRKLHPCDRLGVHRIEWNADPNGDGSGLYDHAVTHHPSAEQRWIAVSHSHAGIHYVCGQHDVDGDHEFAADYG